MSKRMTPSDLAGWMTLDMGVRAATRRCVDGCLVPNDRSERSLCYDPREIVAKDILDELYGIKDETNEYEFRKSRARRR